MKSNSVGIILAAGKGTRIDSKKINKAAYPFLGKPMIVYAVELLEGICDETVVVVGAFAHSVRSALKGKDVIYAYQKQQLGTGHALKVGFEVVVPYSPKDVLVGYGDHMMFYKKETIKSFIAAHKRAGAAVSLIVTNYDKPNELAWGRIIRGKDGSIIDIVEQKDADEKQKQIQELNAGFYCFDYRFLIKNIAKLKRSPITCEYYLTDMIKIAIEQGEKAISFPVPFNQVGLGVNRYEELIKSQQLYSQTH